MDKRDEELDAQLAKFIEGELERRGLESTAENYSRILDEEIAKLIANGTVIQDGNGRLTASIDHETFMRLDVLGFDLGNSSAQRVKELAHKFAPKKQSYE
jgi:hypothetical protein